MLSEFERTFRVGIMRINNQYFVSLLSSTDFSGDESDQLHSRVILLTKNVTKTLEFSSRCPERSQISVILDEESAGVLQTWWQLSDASARPRTRHLDPHCGHLSGSKGDSGEELQEQRKRKDGNH